MWSGAMLCSTVLIGFEIYEQYCFWCFSFSFSRVCSSARNAKRIYTFNFKLNECAWDGSCKIPKNYNQNGFIDWCCVGWMVCFYLLFAGGTLMMVRFISSLIYGFKRSQVAKATFSLFPIHNFPILYDRFWLRSHIQLFIYRANIIFGHSNMPRVSKWHFQSLFFSLSLCFHQYRSVPPNDSHSFPLFPCFFFSYVSFSLPSEWTTNG